MDTLISFDLIYKKVLIFVLINLACCVVASGQQIIALYDGKIPFALPCETAETVPAQGELAGVTVPTLTVFYPVKKDLNRTSVIIMPGGGYDHLAMENEGYAVARAFNKIGVTAFVLKYRLPFLKKCFSDHRVVALQDAQQAMHLIRSNAKIYDINPDKIGVLGFSAGGHLAALLATDYQSLLTDKSVSVKPNWLALAYPVISMADSLGVTGTKRNLVGLDASLELKDYYSANLHVTSKTPPSFIFLAQDDKVVSPKHSLLFYQALIKHQVSVEYHVFAKGGHGFGMGNKSDTGSWLGLLEAWLHANGWLKGE